MANPYEYFTDGASPNAQAVLVYLGDLAENIDASYVKDTGIGNFQAHPRVARFNDDRNRGYAITVPNRRFNKFLHIVFYTHGVACDRVCIREFENESLSPPYRWSDVELVNNYDDPFPAGTVKKDYDFVHPRTIAEYIDERMNEFWKREIASVEVAA